MSVVPTELTPGKLLTLFRRPLQTSSSPLFESIFPLFLTMSGIPALNLNLPIFNSCWHLDQPQSITTNTISLMSWSIPRDEIYRGVASMRWSQQALPHCVLCFRRSSDRRDQTFLARRTGQRQRGSHQCCKSNTSCTDASCECAWKLIYQEMYKNESWTLDFLSEVPMPAESWKRRRHIH